MKLFSRQALFKTLDATLGYLACWTLGCAQFLARRGRIATDPEIRDPGRILVIRPGGMGDMLLLLPAIEKIRRRFPNSRIEWVCESRNLAVLRLVGLAENAIPYDTSPFRLLAGLWKMRYDVVIDTEQFHNFSAVLAFLTGSAVRIGFKINPHRNLLYSHLVSYAVDEYEGKQFMRLLVPLGIEDLAYRLEGILFGIAPPAAPDRAPWLEKVRGLGPFVAIAPGSATRYKRWAPDRFAELARSLHDRRGLGVVVVGGKDAREAARLIEGPAEGQSRPFLSLAGILSLAETAALIKEARLFVGTDSGLAHLAVAVGVPTVVIFGPSDHVKWGLEDDRHAVVRRPLACSPCFIFGYHRLCRTMACMSGVGVEDVLQACERLLARLSPGGTP